jgi:hypothetical protein
MPKTNSTKTFRAANNRHAERDVPEGTKRPGTSTERPGSTAQVDNARNDRLMGLASRDQL